MRKPEARLQRTTERQNDNRNNECEYENPKNECIEGDKMNKDGKCENRNSNCK